MTPPLGFVSPSLEQMLASFAYKPKPKSKPTTTATATAASHNRERGEDGDCAGDLGGTKYKKNRKERKTIKRKKKKVLAVSPYFTATLAQRVREARFANGEEVEVVVVVKKPQNKNTDWGAEQSGGETRIGGLEESKHSEIKNREKKKRKGRSVCLSNAERFSDAYKRVSDDHPWVPLFSDHELLQEFHFIDHWRVLVVCMLLNRTTGREVRKVLPRLFLLCPDAEATTKVPTKQIEERIRPLGLQSKRAEAIKKLSSEYLRPDWTHVTQLPGIGKYAADAYAIFCSGRWKEVEPNDHKLVDYWRFLIEHKDLLESIAELQSS